MNPGSYHGAPGGRGAARGGSGGRNAGRNPPPSTGAPGAHRAGGGCPLLVVFFSMLGTALKWLLVKRKI